jgi:hypothetical protein
VNLLQYLEDERPVELKGNVIRIREPPLFVHIPPRRRPVIVPVKKTEGELSGDVK